jgi:hypothetical protein
MKEDEKMESKLLTLDKTKLFHEKKKKTQDQLLYSQIPAVISLNTRRVFYIININVDKFMLQLCRRSEKISCSIRRHLNGE